MGLMRRLRGVAGTMGIWALAFGVVGVVLLTLELLVYDVRPPIPAARLLLAGLVGWGLAGAAMGLVFASAILLIEGRRTFGALSVRRFTASGFVAGAIVPMAIGAAYAHGRNIILRRNLIDAAIFGVLGAALAAATLRAARRAPASLDDGLGSVAGQPGIVDP